MHNNPARNEDPDDSDPIDQNLTGIIFTRSLNSSPPLSIPGGGMGVLVSARTDYGEFRVVDLTIAGGSEATRALSTALTVDQALALANLLMHAAHGLEE